MALSEQQRRLFSQIVAADPRGIPFTEQNEADANELVACGLARFVDRPAHSTIHVTTPARLAYYIGVEDGE